MEAAGQANNWMAAIMPNWQFFAGHLSRPIRITTVLEEKEKWFAPPCCVPDTDNTHI